MALEGRNAIGPNEYWKLRTYDHITVDQKRDLLTQRGYYSGCMRKPDVLNHYLQRSDRGMLSYTNRSNDELRNLIVARGVETSTWDQPKGQRNLLIRDLVWADEHPQFESFTRLPAEVRSQIYTYYCAEFDRPLDAPKQPPIALTCSLIRKEALPIFYSNCTFEIKLVAPRGLTRFRHLKLTTETLMWLHCTRRENMADIRNLQVTAFRKHNFAHALLRFDLRYDKHARRWIRAPVNATWPGISKYRVTLGLDALLDLMIVRGGDQKLTKEDCFKLRKIVEAALV